MRSTVVCHTIQRITVGCAGRRSCLLVCSRSCPEGISDRLCRCQSLACEFASDNSLAPGFANLDPFDSGDDLVDDLQDALDKGRVFLRKLIPYMRRQLFGQLRQCLILSQFIVGIEILEKIGKPFIFYCVVSHNSLGLRHPDASLVFNETSRFKQFCCVGAYKVVEVLPQFWVQYLQAVEGFVERDSPCDVSRLAGIDHYLVRVVLVYLTRNRDADRRFDRNNLEAKFLSHLFQLFVFDAFHGQLIVAHKRT